MDKSATSMGGRTLRKWIEEPLLIKKEIEYRLDSVEELVNNIYLNEDLREELKNIYDIERIVGKISNQNVNAKELLSLKTSLQKIPSLKKTLSVKTIQWKERFCLGNRSYCTCEFPFLKRAQPQDICISDKL